MTNPTHTVTFIIPRREDGEPVITEVLEAQDSVATFHRGQAIGCWDSDRGGCAA